MFHAQRQTKSQRHLLSKFVRFPLISEELLTFPEPRVVPAKSSCCVHRNHQTKLITPRESSSFSFLVLGSLGSPLMGITHAATGGPTANKKDLQSLLCFPIHASPVEGIPFKSSLFKMIQMICTVCVNIRSTRRTYSEATMTRAASENQSNIHVSSESGNYFSKQDDFT